MPGPVCPSSLDDYTEEKWFHYFIFFVSLDWPVSFLDCLLYPLEVNSYNNGIFHLWILVVPSFQSCGWGCSLLSLFFWFLFLFFALGVFPSLVLFSSWSNRKRMVHSACCKLVAILFLSVCKSSADWLCFLWSWRILQPLCLLLLLCVSLAIGVCHSFILSSCFFSYFHKCTFSFTPFLMFFRNGFYEDTQMMIWCLKIY